MSLCIRIALPNHFVVLRIGHRAVVMVGGICSFISLLVAAVAPSVTLWSIAVGGGLGEYPSLCLSFVLHYYCDYSIMNWEDS